MSPEAVRVTTLPSGLQIVTETMDRVETISFGAYVASGTRNEEASHNGVSHFLEHMAFKGTERRTAAEIAEAVENVGGHINAYTAREQTAYYVKMLKEDLALGADIIGDILTHSGHRGHRQRHESRRHCRLHAPQLRCRKHRGRRGRRA
jgi:predicted Zn-dependent peptidase